ncbi:hypothetical protein ECANGB1_1562 [Enterospora canceri]|uniref:Uncharacterized protein n=1 Tax=Enterospora canceri TaxID=1081671 RepID=A0A1Y1S3R4_9MICR|nr:hypothetical protein ECANGB1_2241 [Enterospora canceri]ORD93038.1 hypothetical protein ECANGB1_1562 [Enterospora canceri]
MWDLGLDTWLLAKLSPACGATSGGLVWPEMSWSW